MSDSTIIVCPCCQHQIPLNEALVQKIREDLQAKFEREKRNLVKDVQEATTEKFEQEISKLKSDIGGKEKQIKDFTKKELELRTKQKELEAKNESLDLEIFRRVSDEKKKLKEEYDKKIEVAKKEAFDEIDFERIELQRKLEVKDKSLNEFKQRENDLKKTENELKEKISDIDSQIEEKVNKVKEKFEEERIFLIEQTKVETISEVNLEVVELKEKLSSRDSTIESFRKKELELRKLNDELDEKNKNIDIEIARKIEEGKMIMEGKIKNRLQESHIYELKKKEKENEDLKNKIEELSNKVKQGSQKMQGEIQEIMLEEYLKTNFLGDKVEPISSGIRGADVIQKIYSNSGKYCGTILWESKKTKSWSKEWPNKLKEDQREIKADLSIIYTNILPEGIQNFGQIDGVWVTNFESIIGLTSVLRESIIQINLAKLSEEGRSQKMEMIYDYLAGSEFRQKVEAMIESFKIQFEDLQKEKRAMQRMWAKREKEIQKVIKNTSTMYGDVQGIVGASLPEIQGLLLDPMIEDIVEEVDDE